MKSLVPEDVATALFEVDNELSIKGQFISVKFANLQYSQIQYSLFKFDPGMIGLVLSGLVLSGTIFLCPSLLNLKINIVIIFDFIGGASILRCITDDQVTWETCLSNPVVALAADL